MVMIASHKTATGCAHVNTKSYGFSSANAGRCNVKIGAATAGIKKLANRAMPAAIDAIEDGRPTMECIQPNMNPHCGPKARRKYAYSPPASGIAAPNSANESAPNIESTAPTTHAANTTETNRPSRAISAGFRKMPVPIIVPTTIAAEAHGPSPRTSSKRLPLAAALILSPEPQLPALLHYRRKLDSPEHQQKTLRRRRSERTKCRRRSIISTRQ